MARIGFRWDRGDTKNFIEGGYQGGQRTGLPSSIQFVPSSPIATALVCDLNDPGKSLTGCLSSRAKLTDNADAATVAQFAKLTWTAIPSYDSRQRIGPFLRHRIELPVPALKELTIRSEGTTEFFHDLSGDVNADTRWLSDWTVALRLGLWNNLSVGPTYRKVFFESKVKKQAITGQTVSFDLEYRFQWRPHLPSSIMRVPYPK